MKKNGKMKKKEKRKGKNVRMCKMLRHSCHSARMMMVSVARQRIVIHPACLSHPLLSPSNKQEVIRRSHSINWRHLHTLVAEPGSVSIH